MDQRQRQPDRQTTEKDIIIYKTEKEGVREIQDRVKD